MRNIFTLTILLALTLLARETHACSIETKERLVLVSKKQNISVEDIGESTQCQNAEIQSFLSFIKNGKGMLRKSIIQKEEELLNDASISPASIHVEHLGELIKTHLDLREDFEVTEISPVDKTKVYGLSSSQNLSFSCSNCERKLGRHNVKMQIRDSLSGIEKSVWVRVHLKTRAQALVPRHGLGVTHKGLSRKDFKKKKILTSSPQKIFSNVDKIHFYKLNRQVSKDEVLKNHMVSPQPLVKPGRPANISLESSQLKLSGKALPLKSASYGEVVKLRHPQNNNIIVGKVIDHNKVKIEL